MKRGMFSWAKQVWSSLSPVEKQALRISKRSSVKKPSVYETIVQGKSRTDLWRSLQPPLFSHGDYTRIQRWKRHLLMIHTDTEMKEWTRKERVFGLEIPQEWTGLGASPYFHSKVLRLLASNDKKGNWIHRIMVPNSLGPAQLLLEYGTPNQKQEFLPKLANGDITPCFGLTGPFNGSDAGAIPDIGYIEERNGQKGIRLSCEKRWITLSPISELLGLAIRIHDEHKVDKGITLVLISLSRLQENEKKKINIEWHHPVGSEFPNGYISIQDLWIPLEESIIGGSKNIGKGWIMLMKCLQHGRGISLPSVTLGANASLSWHTLWYTLVRHQFQRPLIDLYAVQVKLGEMHILWFLTWILNEFYHADLQHGGQSSSFSACMKWLCTDFHRRSVLHAMDIFGGKGITQGPLNPILHYFLQHPIAITVEGSNDLTRHVIVPSQTLFEHHPYLSDMIDALETNDANVFYKTLQSIIVDVVKHTCQSPFSTQSRLVLQQYQTLLYASKLRQRQDVSKQLADQIGLVLLQQILDWAKQHPEHFGEYPEIWWTMCHEFIQVYFQKQVGKYHSPRIVETIAKLPLQHISFCQNIEQDIILPERPSHPQLPFLKVRHLWFETKSDCTKTFVHHHVPLDLQRQIIQVNSFTHSATSSSIQN